MSRVIDFHTHAGRWGAYAMDDDPVTFLRIMDAAGGDLSERHPCRRAGDRSGDRRHRDPELCRGRRFRRDAEPDHAAGPGPWRRGTGDRSGALGGRRLRRRRTATDRINDGLCHPEIQLVAGDTTLL